MQATQYSITLNVFRYLNVNNVLLEFLFDIGMLLYIVCTLDCHKTNPNIWALLYLCGISTIL